MLQRYLQVLMNGGKIVEAPRPLDDGLAAFAAGDHATAEGLLLAAIADKPDEVRALAALGMIALAAGRPEEAAEHLAKARRRLPGDLRIALALADCYMATGVLDRAIDGYKAALRLDATSAEAQRKLGEALHASGRTAEALEALNQAVYRDRKDLAARLLLARICLDGGDERRALAQLHMIDKLEPGRIETQRLLAAAFDRLGDFRQMAVHLAAIVTRGEATLDEVWQLANLNLMFGRREEALPLFQRAAMAEPTPGPAHEAVAQVAEELGRFALAIETWRLLAGVKEYQCVANAAVERVRALRGGTGHLVAA